MLTGPAEHLQQGCCSYGAHFIDDDDLAAVEQAAARLTKEQWQFRAKGKRGGILAKDDDGARTTRVVDGACIFLNRPGFAGGVGCALHIGALEAGERPLDWKPDVCWQLPLRLEERTDEHGHVTSFVREWKRRDWGDGGHEFHWWCTDSPEAFRRSQTRLPLPARRVGRDDRQARLRPPGPPTRRPSQAQHPPPPRRAPLTHVSSRALAAPDG